MASVKVFEALDIYEDPRRAAAIDRIFLSRHVNFHGVGHPRATALLDKKTQAIFLRGKTLLLEQLEKVPGGGIGEFNHGRK